MNSNFDYRILTPEDKDRITAFAKERHAQKHDDPMERELSSWTARWRGEALDHYLKMGWSYGAFQNDQLKGFVLGQPFLFFRGLTQTLWIETIDAESETLAHDLLDCATRWARDKHFQCALLEEGDKGFKVIKTARF